MQIPLGNSKADRPQLIGFLTAVECDSAVLGGYLLLNAAARPVEFHCTAPVRANRAQEILYGPTLRPYLYGEQIGKTLLSKSKPRPALVVTDCEPMLAVRGVHEVLIACLGDGEWDEAGGTLRLGDDAVTLPNGFGDDRQALLDRWRELGAEFDIREPFSRIHEAISEAQKTRKAA